jgi:plastocyanin
MPSVSRRRFLRAVATTTVAVGLAGCGSGEETDSEKEAADVIAGPGGALSYDPETLTVSVGDTVTWYFDSGGHNVACAVEDSDRAALPEGAEQFASYGVDGDPIQTEPRGETYEHTFETPGEYTYVCIPHERSNMIADVVVEE